jgi:hypothetical protein
MSPERHGSVVALGRHMRRSCLVLPRIIVVAGLSAIAIAASGCSGDSDAEAESSPATTTEQVATQPPAQPTVDISKFRAAFKETFGTPPDERPWYGLITGMKMAPREIVTATSSYRVLEITTKLESPSDTVVSEICEAVFALDSEMRNGIEAVRVIDSDGEEGGCA